MFSSSSCCPTGTTLRPDFRHDQKSATQKERNLAGTETLKPNKADTRSGTYKYNLAGRTMSRQKADELAGPSTPEIKEGASITTYAWQPNYTQR